MKQSATASKPQPAREPQAQVSPGTDLVEWYYQQGFTDGLPVVPPTPEKVSAMVAALGGEPDKLLQRIPPRWGQLTREVLAINMVMAGCRPEYAPVVQAAITAVCENHFNLNGVQTTTHAAAPLMIVNGPIRNAIGMNAGVNAFGAGNRANATIGRAIRLVLLNVGGAEPGRFDMASFGSPSKYTYSIAENEEASPWAPYHVEKGFMPEDSTVFMFAGDGPRSIFHNESHDPYDVLSPIISAMSTVTHNNALHGGSCVVIIGQEHAKILADQGWTKHDVRMYLWMQARNKYSDYCLDPQTGGVRSDHFMPHYYRRQPDADIPIVPHPDDIHLFCAGGVGVFSLFIPGWGRMSAPVLRAIDGTSPAAGKMICVDGTCYL